jgi:hypothetical protein
MTEHGLHSVAQDPATEHLLSNARKRRIHSLLLNNPMISAHVFIPQKFLRLSREPVTLAQNKLRAPDGEQVIHPDKSDRNGPAFRLL